MKLAEFNVTNFRSVNDSGPIAVDNVTCLVGKNEAGKTALLHALYRLNPIVPGEGVFDVTDDFPRKAVEDYKHEVESGQRRVASAVEATFKLDADDIAAVEAVFGPKALTGTTLVLSKNYANVLYYTLGFNELTAIKNKAASSSFTSESKAAISASTSWEAVAEVLETITDPQHADERNALASLISGFEGQGAVSHAFKILKPLVPKFLYFDEYYQMKGHENIQALLERKKSGTLDKSDHPLLGLINLARLDMDDLLQAKRTAELNNKLEGAGNHLTKRILKYWSQNKHIQLRFDVREARPEDPEGMQSGTNIWGRVYDAVHWATTELGTRSKGFLWFFSFLAWYEDIKRSERNLILLLDEPGLTLHGLAQADLLKYIEEELSTDHQVLYTTHSPFMVDARRIDRVRIVQDLGIDADIISDEKQGTKVTTDVLEATSDSLFPLQGALGYEIQQSLFVGPNTLIVEGASDLLYLWEMSAILEREGRVGLSKKWVITPTGGSTKVPTFVALLAPQSGMKVATLIDLQNSDKQKIESIYKERLLKRANVFTFADFTGTSEADIEDMFDRKFYLDIVNAEYKDSLQKPIGISSLNQKIPRILRAIEEHLKGTPLKSGGFGHYRPARHFVENSSKLSKKVDGTTKDRFEEAFKSLNALL